MTYLLLLGAGFSRNWGGWLAAEVFEYLLGDSAIQMNSYLKGEMWRQGNVRHDFEEILADLRRTRAERPADPTYGPAVAAFEGAIRGMFDVVNAAFRGAWPLSHPTCVWLTKFDAIFTLNQDLLLELSCFPREIAILSNKRHPGGADIPGMVPAPGIAPPNPLEPPPWCGAGPMIREDDLVCAIGSQPYYKLHGSANWSDKTGQQMLIMGSNKVGQIAADDLMTHYQKQFAEYLSRKPCRLMVIGYSFRDRHINNLIEEAARLGNLQIFVVDPNGSEATRGADQRAPGALGDGVNSQESPLQNCIFGASRRNFRDTIEGRDAIEREKLDRFFRT